MIRPLSFLFENLAALGLSHIEVFFDDKATMGQPSAVVERERALASLYECELAVVLVNDALCDQSLSQLPLWELQILLTQQQPSPPSPPPSPPPTLPNIIPVYFSHRGEEDAASRLERGYFPKSSIKCFSKSNTTTPRCFATIVGVE